MFKLAHNFLKRVLSVIFIKKEVLTNNSSILDVDMYFDDSKIANEYGKW